MGFSVFCHTSRSAVGGEVVDHQSHFGIRGHRPTPHELNRPGDDDVFVLEGLVCRPREDRGGEVSVPEALVEDGVSFVVVVQKELSGIAPLWISGGVFPQQMLDGWVE